MKLSRFSFFLLAGIAELACAEGEENNFEWAGAFSLSDNQHVWSMQKVGGSYADPSMRIVGFALVSATGPDAIEANEDAANALLAGTDCPAARDGETVGPFPTTGACFELRVNEDANDSFFTMNTQGLAALALFTAHVPTEFERDRHYLQDSSGQDVEPVIQEGGGHHHHHGDDDDHDDKPTCACAADEHNFKLDCTASAAMLDALSILKTTDCATDCSSDECQKNWYIVQSHHDYCDPQALPEAVEDDFHDFDETCKSCAIERQFIEGAPDCPEPNCNDQSGNEAYAFLVENGCAADNKCEDDQDCRDKYTILRTVHDSCDHDVLSTDAEEGLHDFEEPCEAVVCNAPGSQDDQLTCPGAGGSGSVVGTSFSVGTLCAVVGVAFMVAF